ncbi:DUF1816 domain-containing protein [Pleurocapsales cyanobacterium LEGE 10410]|nr:DUF1816 domain-containing protein [Pleurocapsales cyanobacterium LEGE 10410]
MLLKVADRLKTAVRSFVKSTLARPYWVEVTTRQPSCIYYFGPFDNVGEAEQMQHGYVQDLVEEQANGISVEVKRCLPTELTILGEESLVG